MKKKRQKKPKQWFGCYQDQWKGHITAASFQHPAKFAKGLVERILDYMAERKWIAKGDVIGDPFGGVGTGGIVAAYRGYQWIGCELEPKFVKLADDNFIKHLPRLAALRVPLPIMLLGDSRYFHRRIDMELRRRSDVVVTSPPYVSGGHHADVMNAGNTNGRGQSRPIAQTVAQVGIGGGEQLTNQSSAIVSSPPYAGSLDDGGPEKAHPDGYKRSSDWTGYGKSDGQIAALKSGDVDAVVGSPPFLGCRSDTTSSGGGINKRGYKGKHADRPSHRKMAERTYQPGSDKDRDPANIEVLGPGSVAAVIASPPYETIKAGAGGLNHLPARDGDKQSGRDPESASQSADQSYGTTPGQIAHCKKASVDAVISSPPYADSINSDSHGIDFSKAKADYPGRIQTAGRVARHKKGADDMRYGDTPGQIGSLKAVVASPPWEKNVEGGRAAGKFKGAAGALKVKRGKGASDKAVLAQVARDETKTLGNSEGQIGQERGETYWQAVAKVYHSCLLSLKPGGVMALVVKDFCKDKKRMRLCDDTMRLLVWIGFEEVERVHAMLTEEQIHDDMFEGTTTKRTERKSFFRRNYEKNMSADDPRRIDFEEVLFVRKPLEQKQ